MDEKWSYLYIIMLYITAAGSISVKPLCIYIIIKKTPKYMTSVSYFILNELIWNFVGNLMFTLAHPIPMLPAVCFRMDGVVGSLLKTELQRSIFLIAIVITVFNCVLAFVTTFLFRYVTIAYSRFISQVDKAWCYFSCIVVHSVLSILVALSFHYWWVPISEYPFLTDLPEDKENMFCYHPVGSEIVTVFSFFFSFFGVALFCGILFAGLSIRELRIQSKHMEKKTLSMQKEILRNLLITAGIAASLGGTPLVIALFYLYNNQLPFSQAIVSGSLVITLNFGTLYASLVLSRFKAYREAFLGLIKGTCKTLQVAVGVGKQSNTISSSTIF
uniref:G_PROTEIN_RECEP_F1_2 domain-containing protein n=1 Tax=Steinernema glaseri TaxID=37863 RepID=A0A1I8ALB3_9BILA